MRIGSKRDSACLLTAPKKERKIKTFLTSSGLKSEAEIRNLPVRSIL
jgi:hypothetical protein